LLDREIKFNTKRDILPLKSTTYHKMYSKQTRMLFPELTDDFHPVGVIFVQYFSVYIQAYYKTYNLQ